MRRLPQGGFGRSIAPRRVFAARSFWMLLGGRFIAVTLVRRDRSIQTLLQLRSEEHTSELQSQSNLVCRLLLEKKKKNRHAHNTHNLVSYYPIARKRAC